MPLNSPNSSGQSVPSVPSGSSSPFASVFSQALGAVATYTPPQTLKRPSVKPPMEQGAVQGRVPWMAWHQEGVVVTLNDLEQMDDAKLLQFHRDVTLKEKSVLDRIALLERNLSQEVSSRGAEGDAQKAGQIEYVRVQLQKARRAHLGCLDFLRETAPRAQKIKEARVAKAAEAAKALRLSVTQVLEAKMAELRYAALGQRVALELCDILGEDKGEALFQELSLEAEREGFQRLRNWLNEKEQEGLDQGIVGKYVAQVEEFLHAV